MGLDRVEKTESEMFHWTSYKYKAVYRLLVAE